MPRYDFKCEECQNLFELNLSLEEREKESLLKKCPSCDSLRVKQQLSFGGVLKGGRTVSPASRGGSPCEQRGCPNAGRCHLDN